MVLCNLAVVRSIPACKERRSSAWTVFAHVYGKSADGCPGTASGDCSVCMADEAGCVILSVCVSWDMVSAVTANDRGDPYWGSGYGNFFQDAA